MSFYPEFALLSLCSCPVLPSNREAPIIASQACREYNPAFGQLWFVGLLDFR